MASVCRDCGQEVQWKRCRDCGQEVQWRRTRNGNMAPYNKEPQIHFATCSARKPSGPNAQRKDAGAALGPNVQRKAARLFLVELGYKPKEAGALVAVANGQTIEELITGALREAGREQ